MGKGKGKTYHGAVSNLQWLEDLQEKSCRFPSEEIPRSERSRVVDLVCAEDGRYGGGEVRQHAGEADVVGLFGHFGEVKGAPDGVLRDVSLQHFPGRGWMV